MDELLSIEIFDNLSDVLYWQCDQKFEEVLVNYTEQDNKDPMGFIQYYFEYWMNNSEIIELIFSINRQDIIYACHMKNSQIITEKYRDRLQIPVKYYDYYMTVRTGVTISILMTWLDGGKKETVNELIEIIYLQIKAFKVNDMII